MRKAILATAISGLLMISFSNNILASENKALSKKHQKIERQFPDVLHLSASDPRLQNAEDIVIFDVREEREYAVSHLKNAIRVDPDIDEESFVQQFSARTKDKTVVFYCSVGQRSSILADKLQSSLIDTGAKAAYNLEGGIFNWHNQQRSLVSLNKAKTDKVHPYNTYWARMVNNKSKTSYTPEN